MDRVSEKEVVNSMQALVSTLQKLLEQHVAEQTEQIIAIWEREKCNKILERKILEIKRRQTPWLWRNRQIKTLN